MAIATATPEEFAIDSGLRTRGLAIARELEALLRETRAEITRREARIARNLVAVPWGEDEA